MKALRYVLIILVISAGFLVSKGAKAATSCTLNGATWSLNGTQLDLFHGAKVGDTVTLKVTGQGCDGLSVSFDIYEWDPVSNDYLRSVQSKISNGTAQTNVTLTAQDYAKGGNEYLGEDLLFNAKAFDGSGNQVSSISSHLSASNQNDLVEFSQAWYACVAADGKYACSPGNKSDLSDVANNACQGKKAIQIDSSLCGNGASSSSSSGGAGSSSSGSGGGGSGGSGSGIGTTGATAPENYSFEITNPLAGGPNTLFDVIDIVTKWLITFSIPLSVLFILWAGFLFLTAGPRPGNVKKAQDILKWTVVGLAIIFIGRGFITLIYSVLDLQNSNAPTVQQNSSSAAPTCDNGVCSNGAGPCSVASQCVNNTTQNNPNGTLQSAPTLDNANTNSLPSGASNGSLQYQNVLNISVDGGTDIPVGQYSEIGITVQNPAGPGETFNWSKTSGNLPPGMSVVGQSSDTSQRIAGTPTNKGSYTFTLQAMDIAAREIGTVKITVNVQ